MAGLGGLFTDPLVGLGAGLLGAAGPTTAAGLIGSGLQQGIANNIGQGRLQAQQSALAEAQLRQQLLERAQKLAAEKQQQRQALAQGLLQGVPEAQRGTMAPALGLLGDQQLANLALPQAVEPQGLLKVGQNEALYDPVTGKFIEPPRPPQQPAGPNMEAELKVRDRWRKAAKPLEAAAINAEKIRAALNQKDAIGALSAMVGYLKLIDPTSVARESEVEGVRSAGSLYDRINTMFAKAKSGGMTTALRNSLSKAVSDLARVYKTHYDRQRQDYERLAQRYKLDEQAVLGTEPDFGLLPADGGAGAQPTPAAPASGGGLLPPGDPGWKYLNEVTVPDRWRTGSKR